MLSIKPIPEKEAKGEIGKIYLEIKRTFKTKTVPLVFQYLAAFPPYFLYFWQQAKQNLTDVNFCQQSEAIKNFSHQAISQIYQPSSFLIYFLDELSKRPEIKELEKFIEETAQVTSSLYFLSLATRESIKGIYLGIKQIGERVEDKEKELFSSLFEEFSQPETTNTEEKTASFERSLSFSTRQITPYEKGKIVPSFFAQFFRLMEAEVRKLQKREDYLLRRVELERFALSLLPLISYPLESSFATVVKQTKNYPQFPELIYLLSELFPTQAPLKLLSISVMKKALEFPRKKEIMPV